jgi:hypothetical protein
MILITLTVAINLKAESPVAIDIAVITIIANRLALITIIAIDLPQQP